MDILFLNAFSHFLVDGLCASTVFGRLGEAENLPALILLYNTLAFSTQCIMGLAADSVKRHSCAACVSMGAVICGYALPLPPLVRILLIGLGNSVFHVAGGSITLEQSRGKAWQLDVFVAPGAVGLTIGTLFPRAGVLFAVLMAVCAIAMVPVSTRTRTESQPVRVSECDTPVLTCVLLASAVAVRSIGGAVVRFPWKTGAEFSLLTTLCVFAGKMLGGFLCDRLGAGRTALLSILPASVLISFCSQWMLLSLLGQFALNLTMPVTLWLLYCAMPDAPGFAFGLAASALWPGSLIGKLIPLTGTLEWFMTMLCFLFGLRAILSADMEFTKKGRNEP